MKNKSKRKLLVDAHLKAILFPIISGYYMYIETSYPRKQGDKARLSSPVYTPLQGGQCFQFWYHMYGSNVNTLNVYIKTGSALGIPVWIRSGNRGNVWKVAQIAITATSNFHVRVLVFSYSTSSLFTFVCFLKLNL